jgi:probable rRNA maturation factor
MKVTVSNRQRLLKVDTRRLKQLAQRALELVGASEDQLSIVLVNDKSMAKLNQQYHHTPGPTDILSFDYGSGEGELIISIEHVCDRARQFRATPSRELALYIVHGILHLHGHDDLTARKRARMRVAERRLLARLQRDPGIGKLFKT